MMPTGNSVQLLRGKGEKAREKAVANMENKVKSLEKELKAANKKIAQTAQSLEISDLDFSDHKCQSVPAMGC